MKKLIRGIVEFGENLTDEGRRLFAELALGQRPDVLFIACSDSRVVPNLFASTNPGDLFVVRNLGNLVPPQSLATEDSSVIAALEFAVLSLNVRDIVVCGHSECGAMQALIHGIDKISCSHVGCWLKYGAPSLQKQTSGLVFDTALSEHNVLSQINVLQQMEHLTSYPFVLQKMEQRSLRLHGWWFDVAQAAVYCFEPSYGRFVLIDAPEAELILQRLKQ